MINKFTAASIALVLVVLAGLSWTLDQVYLELDDDTNNTEIDRRVASVLPLMHLMAEQPNHTQLSAQLNQYPQAGFTYQSVEPQALPKSLLAMLKQQDHVLLEMESGYQLLILTSDGTRILVARFDKPDESKRPLKLILTIVFYAGLILALLVWLYPFARRLHLLRKAAKQIGEGDFSTRVPEGAGWYLKDIEQEFNGMAERIAQLLEDIKLLSGGLSHELRTPLARIRMGIDTLSETDDPALKAKYEDKLNRSLDHMETMIGEMLTFTRLEHALETAEQDDIVVNTLLNQLIDERGEEADINAELPTEPLIVKANQSMLSVALDNILHNACKHAKQRCLITLCRSGENIHIAIEDDGEGIPEDKYDAIFKPFVRLNNNAKTGFGIGLAFSYRVINHLGGTVQVAQGEALGGARFTLTFPIKTR